MLIHVYSIRLTFCILPNRKKPIYWMTFYSLYCDLFVLRSDWLVDAHIDDLCAVGHQKDEFAMFFGWLTTRIGVFGVSVQVGITRRFEIDRGSSIGTSLVTNTLWGVMTIKFGGRVASSRASFARVWSSGTLRGFVLETLFSCLFPVNADYDKSNGCKHQDYRTGKPNDPP